MRKIRNLQFFEIDYLLLKPHFDSSQQTLLAPEAVCESRTMLPTSPCIDRRVASYPIYNLNSYWEGGIFHGKLFQTIAKHSPHHTDLFL